MIDKFDAAYLAHEYRLARHRIVGLLRTNGEVVGERPVPTCPQWTVRELVSHVSGLATEIVRGNPPGEDSQSWVDEIVEQRRGSSLSTLIDEWTTYGPAFEEMAAQTRRLAVPLTYDTVVHEHDLRHALNCPGARDTSGVFAAMEVGVWLMTNDLDRRGFGRVAFRAGGRDWICGSGDTRLRLNLDVNLDPDNDPSSRPPIWELLRLTGSRRSMSQLAKLGWEGDFAAGLPALLHMELPVHDIEE